MLPKKVIINMDVEKSVEELLELIQGGVSVQVYKIYSVYRFLIH